MMRWMMGSGRACVASALAAAAAAVMVVGLQAPLEAGENEAWSGRVWLATAQPLDGGVGVGGELTAPAAAELAVAGGALLVSGRSDGACRLEAQIGSARGSVELGSQPAVVHLALEASAASSVRGWSLSARGVGCAVALEGAVLFVGEAAAYVGDDPAAYWASVRASDGLAVR